MEKKKRKQRQARSSRDSDGFYSGNDGAIAFATEEKGGGEVDVGGEWEEPEVEEDPSLRDAIDFAIDFAETQRRGAGPVVAGSGGGGGDATAAVAAAGNGGGGGGGGNSGAEQKQAPARPAPPTQVFDSSLYYAPPALAFTNTGFQDAAPAAPAAVPMVVVKSAAAKAAAPRSRRRRAEPAKPKNEAKPIVPASESEQILLMQAGATTKSSVGAEKSKSKSKGKGKKKTSNKLRRRLPPWASRSSPTRARSTRAQVRQRLARIVAQPDPLAETSPARVAAAPGGGSLGEAFESRLEHEQGDAALRLRRLALIWSEKIEPIHAWAEEEENDGGGSGGVRLGARGEIENDRYGKGDEE